MKTFQRTLCAISTALLLCGFTASAQQANKFNVSGAVRLSSNYVWRGTECCGANFMPDINLSYAGLYFDISGYVSLDWTYKEIDLQLGYKVGPVEVCVADYYCPTVFPENAFNWRKGESQHMMEAAIAFNPVKVPITLYWSTFFYGFLNEAGKTLFSSYFQIGTYHEFGNYGTAKLFVGSGIFKGVYSYDKDFVVNNVELRYEKSFAISEKLNLPLSASFIVNPYDKQAFLNATVGLEF